MIVLGIDQAVGTTGISIIEEKTNGPITLIGCGIISPSKKITGERLAFIINSIDKIIQKYQPDKVVREGYSFTKNSRAMTPLAELGGAIITKLFEYGFHEKKGNLIILPPTTWKKFALNHGHFDKYTTNEFNGEQLTYIELIKKKFGIRVKTLDDADATMLAYTALKYFKIKSKEIPLNNFTERQIDSFLDNKKLKKFKKKTNIKNKELFSNYELLYDLLM